MELRRLAERATPGPWRVSQFGDDMSLVNLVAGEVDREVAPLDAVDEADAAYIAAASPDRILALIQERDAAVSARQEAERVLRDLKPKYVALLGTMRGIAEDRTVTTLAAARLVASTAAARATLARTRKPAGDLGSRYGKILADRDRLIAEGIDPTDLDMPLPPPRSSSETVPDEGVDGG